MCVMPLHCAKFERWGNGRPRPRKVDCSSNYAAVRSTLIQPICPVSIVVAYGKVSGEHRGKDGLIAACPHEVDDFGITGWGFYTRLQSRTECPSPAIIDHRRLTARYA